VNQYYVYILASKRNGTLYIGVTSDLKKRAYEHKNHFIPGFTREYNVTQLVWYEIHNSIEEARLRERRMKKWKRDWKLKLIDEFNPFWRDLYEEIG
jgi:putative endonuclease